MLRRLWRSELGVAALVSAALTLLAVAGTFGMLAVHFIDQTNWLGYYDDLAQFGDRCRVAVVPWHGDFDAARAGARAWRPQRLPYRGTAAPPKVAEHEALVAACDVDLSRVRDGDYPWMSLGPVFGRSQVWLAGQPVARSESDGEIAFPLPPRVLALDRVTVEIVTARTVDPNAGMASLRPPYVTGRRADVKRLARFIGGFLGEQPAFRLGLAMTFVAFVLSLFATGLRYPDVLWLASFAAAVALHNLSNYGYNFVDAPALLIRTEAATNWLKLFALAMFHVHVARRRVSLRAAGWVGLAATALAVAATYGASEQTFFDWRMLTRLQSLVGAPVLFGVAAWGVVAERRRPGLPPPARARLLRYAGLATLAGVTGLLEVYFEDRRSIDLAPLADLALLFAYGAVLVAELTARQALYFVEVDLRRRRENEAAAATAVANAARMLAHDLRRPFHLTRLLYERFLEDGSATAAPGLRERLVSEIRQAQARAGSLLDALVRFDEPLAVTRVATSGQALLAAAVTEWRAGGGAPQVTLHHEIAPLALDVDAAAVRRVVDNILENAGHATPRDGHMRLSLVRAPERPGAALLAVANSGSFVSPELRERIFETAFTSGKLDGTGLGLAAAKQIVEAHGGEIWCTSEAATGTTFFCTLPLASAPSLDDDVAALAQLALAAPPPGFRASTPRRAASLPLVHLIEDEEVMRLTWEAVVTDARVATYASPEAFLAALAAGDLERGIVVTDFTFIGSRMTGGDLAAKLRAHAPDWCLVLSSNRTLDAEARAAFDAIIDKTPLAYRELARLPRGGSHEQAG